MNSNEIHLVVMEWEYDSERGVDIEAFSNKEKAVEYFHQLIKTEKSNSWISDISSLVEEIEQDSYYAYDQDGESQTHTHISLQTKAAK